MTIADFVEPDLTGWLIGHDILRTQFGKLAAAADEVGAGDRERLVALDDHLAFMVRRLTWHHHHEDDDIFPGLQERDATLAGLLDEMDREHQRIEAGLVAATDTSVAFHRRVNPLRAVHTDLAAHLENEETTVVPAIRRLIPQSAWQLEDQKFQAELGADRELTLLWLLSHLPTPARDGMLAGFPAPHREQITAQLLPAHARHVALLYGS
jgi:iron-sulfur cluster repair protein YtfE (RIC family)